MTETVKVSVRFQFPQEEPVTLEGLSAVCTAKERAQSLGLQGYVFRDADDLLEYEFLNERPARLSRGTRWVPFPTAADRPLVSILDAEGLFVLNAGGGYTTLGFGVANERMERVSRWLGDDVSFDPDHWGTPAHYHAYQDAMRRGKAHHARTGKRCEAFLVPELRGREGWRVEVVDRFGGKRRFIVGRSAGWMPVHLEISRRDSQGGLAVMGSPFHTVRALEKVR